MPQLVFVHGVANRSSDEYKTAVMNRKRLFQELLFGGVPAQVLSPMWGDLVPQIAPAVFDTDGKVGSFNLNIGNDIGGSMMGGRDDALSVSAVGRQDPVAALDAICSEIADRAAGDRRDLRDDELQAFRIATDLIESDRAATLFAGDVDEHAIAAQLTAGAPTAFGLGDLIGGAVTAVSDRVRNGASTLGFGAVRDSLSPAVARFIGDVLVYLKEGALRDKIRAVVREALLQAHAAKAAGQGPIVLVGHSMGGVILVDMLGDPQAAGLPADFAADALLTVGSQPGVFASLDAIGPAPLAGARRSKPACVKLWLNVFDAIDPLAFRADALYSDVQDLRFNSLAGITDTHSKYFQRPQFYARARVRLQQAGIL